MALPSLHFHHSHTAAYSVQEYKMQNAIVPMTMTQNDPHEHEATESARSAENQRRSASRSARRKASPKVEAMREHPRYIVADSFLRVTWLDANGDMKVELGARPVDISEMGMAVQLPEPALLLSRIRLESDKGELLGHGKVRSCRPKDGKYLV